MKTLHCNAILLAHKRVNERVWRMELDAPALGRSAVAGQFVMVRPGAGSGGSAAGEVLLRRPISIHRRTKNGIELLYEVVGKGTGMLAGLKPKSRLDLIGPLGTGFPLAAARNRTPVLIGGGIGAAPLIFLAEELARFPAVKWPTVLLGARTRKDLLCLKEFREAGCHVMTATDDGSCGRRGFVSVLLEELLRFSSAAGSMIIYSCGPQAMLNSIYSLADTAGIPAYVSLEEHMACGIGACMGCTVVTTLGNKRVCKDGPVFNAQDILWGHADEK